MVQEVPATQVCRELPDAIQRRGPGQVGPHGEGWVPLGLDGVQGRNTCNSGQSASSKVR
jgi:hypothetical protein